MYDVFPASIRVELELVLRLAAACGLAYIIGWDRESHRHPAGLRTHLLVALGALVLPRAQAADLEQLAKRVQVLEDREEIRALILAYWQAHDHRDYRMFASLFATNGEWIGGLGTARGPDAIFALMDKSIGHHPLPEGSGTFHVLTNEQIVIDGEPIGVWNGKKIIRS